MGKLSRYLVAAFLLIASNASAVYIVDTGAGATTGGVALGGSFNQSLAGQFMTLQHWRIESVEGWILGGSGQTATAVLYDDSGGLPGTELFAAPFTVNGGAWQWEGAFGLDWLLPAGTYWAAFEVRAGQTLNGGMTGSVPNPLSGYAFKHDLSNGWLPETTNTNLGFRIAATPAVPEPSTVVLMGLGLVGLGYAGRRKLMS